MLSNAKNIDIPLIHQQNMSRSSDSDFSNSSVSGDTALTVVTTEDVVNGDVSNVDALIQNPGSDGISLREALEAINNTANDEGVVYDVDFDNTLSGKRITLNTRNYGQLNIRKDVTIAGPETGGIIISGNQKVRVLNVDDGQETTRTVSLSHLTITQGFIPNGNGAGIRNAENLTIKNSIITGNTGRQQNGTGGGGIFNNVGGTLYLYGSSVTNNVANNGGGIGNFGYYAGKNNIYNAYATIVNSTISDNQTFARGAGIDNSSGGILTVERSTISNNTSRDAGGGINSEFYSSLKLLNSTVSGNTGLRSAGVQVTFYGKGAYIENTTIVNNTVTANDFPFASLGVYSTNLTLKNSIISGTKGASENAQVLDVYIYNYKPENYTVLISGENIVADGSLKGSNVLNVDPKLGPLDDNGGPTQTHLPQTGSPVIDATTSGLSTDQRGVSRPQGSKFDIGAVEVQVNDIFEITVGDVVSISNFGGVGQGTRPSKLVLETVDTLKFTAEGLTADTLLLTQVDDDLELTFWGDESETQVTLQTFALENFDNLLKKTGATVDVDNISFANSMLEDSLDVFNADSTQRHLWNRNTVTFLNELDNKVTGFQRSDDVINGQGGNDSLKGLSGDDILRGGEGNDQLEGGLGDDQLEGGLGDDILRGGLGRDVFVLAVGEGTDTIVDFSVEIDLIGLTGGLSFGQLTFENDQIQVNGEVLATLTGIDTTQLHPSTFVAF